VRVLATVSTMATVHSVVLTHLNAINPAIWVLFSSTTVPFFLNARKGINVLRFSFIIFQHYLQRLASDLLPFELLGSFSGRTEVSHFHPGTAAVATLLLARPWHEVDANQRAWLHGAVEECTDI